MYQKLRMRKYRKILISKRVIGNSQSMLKAITIDGVDLMSDTTWGIIDIVSFGTGEMEKRLDKVNEGVVNVKS